MKTENLKPFTEDRNKKVHEVALFWPGENLIVHGIPGWPANQSQEIAYMQKYMSFKNPVCQTGITSEGQPKPDFCMYYDADDVESKINQWALNIVRLLPSYETGKYQPPKDGYRGACVIVYSPTFSMTESSHDMKLPGAKSSGKPVYTQSSFNNKYSINQLEEVVRFHSTNKGAKQYQAHDNPFHRMF